ncbi:MAG: HD-GYP domain-containing protein [Candidatus Anammoxibacter sp.]
MEAKMCVIDVKGRPEQEKEPATPPDKWEPEKFMPPKLVETFKDVSLPPADRARVVRDYSIEMMKNILESPTAENITATKEGVAEIVDVIMNEGETCENLAKIVSHDFYTYTHSVNVGIKSLLLAKEFYGDSGAHDMHELGAGFFLHDIGKVNISTDIINKRGRLTANEMNEMRKHPEESKKILIYTKHLNREFEVIVMQHHERNDGTGYPLGLKGFDIHPYASICCLADVYDALTGKRSYKTEKTPQEALEIMTKQMENHFSVRMLSKFINIFERSGILI